jgi:ABC-2 type transport system permease protein
MSIYLIVKNEIRRIMKNKKKLLITIFIPVIAVIFAMGVNTIMRPSISLGIIDKGNSEFKTSFISKANDINGVKIRLAKEDTINTDMIMAKYMAIIEFDTNNNIKLYCMDDEIKGNIEEIMNDFSNTKELTGLQELLTKMENESMTVVERSVGFILLTLIITCVITSCNIIKDKDEGTLRRYALTPNAKIHYILGKYIFNFLLTLIQIIISTLIIGMLKLEINMNLSEFLLIGIIIAFIASSISIFVVSLVDTELKASLIASSFGLVISLLGGSFLPLEKMPYGIKIISNVSITKWMIQFTKALESNFHALQNYVPILVIILMSFMFIIVSIILGEKKFV